MNYTYQDVGETLLFNYMSVFVKHVIQMYMEIVLG